MCKLHPNIRAIHQSEGLINELARTTQLVGMTNITENRALEKESISVLILVPKSHL